MMSTIDTLKLALEALEMAQELEEGYGIDFKKYGLEFDKDIRDKYATAITAIKQALAAPVKDNSNYRLDPPGLDPAGGTQVSKVWWDGDKLIAKPIPFVEFYKAAPDLQAELEATNRQVEILSDALAESRREIDAMIALARADERGKWMERAHIMILGEREACAKVCDELHWTWHMGDNSGPKECAAAIRARGNQ
jgi:hypothetical protein